MAARINLRAATLLVFQPKISHFREILDSSGYFSYLPQSLTPDVIFVFMTSVWPTVAVLKVLEKADKLSPRVKAEFEAARSATDQDAKIEHLARTFEFISTDDPLITDARMHFAQGTSNHQKEMTAKAGIPIYEARSREGAAWRGAVVRPTGDTDGWLIYVEKHDRFHNAGPSAISSKKTDGALGPSDLDLAIRDRCMERQSNKLNSEYILSSVLKALKKIAGGESSMKIEMPEDPKYTRASVHMMVEPIVDEETDPLEAHHELSTIRLEFKTSTMTEQVRAELVRLIAQFLQPDIAMHDSIFRQNLVLSIIVTQAQIIHLLSTNENGPLEFRTDPPAPKLLHYTAKNGLTKAYIEGSAVRAICGHWWVPIGDESTHSELPICSKCEEEMPYVKLLSELTGGH